MDEAWVIVEAGHLDGVCDDCWDDPPKLFRIKSLKGPAVRLVCEVCLIKYNPKEAVPGQGAEQNTT